MGVTLIQESRFGGIGRARPNTSAALLLKTKAPPANRQEELRRDHANQLEGKLRRQLNPARPPAAEEGIANANVAGSDDVITSVAYLSSRTAGNESAFTSGWRKISSWIGNKSWQEWVREVRVIQDIEELRAQLHTQAFRDCGVLVNREVPLFKCRPHKGVSALIPKVTRSGHTIA